MQTFCYLMLLAMCLHCTSGSGSAALSGANIHGCNTMTTEQLKQMKDCVNEAATEQIVKKVTDATNGEIKAIEREIPEMRESFETSLQKLRKKIQHLEKKIQANCNCNNQCPQDCDELKRRGKHASGNYTICPGNGSPIEVFCDMQTNEGGWVVFQQQVSGTVSFNQTWNQYKEGFGIRDRDYWLGFDNILRFMNVPNKLRIDVESKRGDFGYGIYNNFHIGDNTTNFMLTVSGFTGNITDQLNNVSQIHRSSGAPFSTYDQDNDNDTLNCAKRKGAGYWYNLCGDDSLPYSMLNGIYPVYHRIGYANPDGWDTIYWHGWPADQTGNGEYNPIIKTKMMLKRK